MNHFNSLLPVLAWFVSAWVPVGDAAELIHQAPHDNPSAAYRWLEITLEASGRDVDRHTARPPILARAMAVVMTSMYDAWSAYDTTAIGTRLGKALGTVSHPNGQRSRT